MLNYLIWYVWTLDKDLVGLAIDNVNELVILWYSWQLTLLENWDVQNPLVR